MKAIILFLRIRQIIFLAIFLLLPLNNYSFNTKLSTIFVQPLQAYKTYKGVVLDSKTNKPLVFADVVLTDSNISTVTNTEGEFSLKITDTDNHKTLTISFLGYEKKEVNLSDLKINDKIYLQPVAIMLTEINVYKSETETAKNLVKATLEHKGLNYASNQHIMTAFYRESIKKRNRNASLSEAVVKIYKQPYKTNKTDVVELIKSRKNTDYNRLDTLALKLQGGPFSTLYVDLMKYTDFIFDYESLDNYDFIINGITKINNKIVHIINFKQKSNIEKPLYYGTLFIDTENFVLVSAIYNLNVSNRDAAAALFVIKKPNKVKVYPTEAAYRVDYRTENGKWHYRYSNIQLTFKVNWKGKLFNSLYKLTSEMAVTNWKTTDFASLKIENNFKPDMILSDEASGFSDPQFWGEYNIIEPEQSIETAIKKISKQLSKV